MKSSAISYYAATAHSAPGRPALQGEITCDVCIIGAGYSGLSTALHLAEGGHKVVILEAETTGFGASGRNGGQIINGYSRDFDTIRGHYGAPTAQALLNMGFEGGDIIRERIEKYKIDCDYRRGSFFAAFNESQMQYLERRGEIWHQAGNTELKLLAKEDIPKIVDTNLYCGGLLDLRGGHIHPLNLALGEAAAFESIGGKIFEKSRVLRIAQGDKPAAYTASGKVNANFLVICGNAYLGETVPQLSGKIMSVSSQIVTTEILGPDLAKKILPADFCVEDCNYLLDYYRLTADHRLLFGGGVVYSGNTPADIIERLQPHIVKTFPILKDKKIEFAWSGNFALTLTRMPHIGRLSDTVYFIQGDSGHGVTTCHLLGKLVAEAISHQSSRFDVFASLKHFPFPGGRMFCVPLTALGAWYYGIKEKLGL